MHAIEVSGEKRGCRVKHYRGRKFRLICLIKIMESRPTVYLGP